MSEGKPVAVLFLRLEGPLQSWGDDSRWSVRRTRPEPTRSGVIGMLAAALGYGYDAAGEAEVVRLGRELSLGVRADREGSPLRDYHTVVGGVLSAEGRVKINAASREPETVVSERYYLADACFLAALAGPPELLERIRAAVQDPRWLPFLGRKSCPPSRPLYPALPRYTAPETFRDLEEALETHPSLARRNDPAPPYRAVWEPAPGAGRGLRLQRRDVPLSFGKRLFEVRTVCEAPVSPPVLEELMVPGLDYAMEARLENDDDLSLVP